MAKIKTYLYGKIDEEGRLTFDDAAAFARVRGQYREQPVQVLIEPKKKQRSLSENGYYWGVVIQLLSDWSGYTPDEMHDALKEKFLLTFDEEHKLARMKSSANLSSIEFENFMSRIRTWASEQGVFIPLPNEDIY